MFALPVTPSGESPLKNAPETLVRRAILANVELVELPIYQSYARYSIGN